MLQGNGRQGDAQSSKGGSLTPAEAGGAENIAAATASPARKPPTCGSAFSNRSGCLWAAEHGRTMVGACALCICLYAWRLFCARRPSSLIAGSTCGRVILEFAGLTAV